MFKFRIYKLVLLTLIAVGGEHATAGVKEGLEAYRAGDYEQAYSQIRYAAEHEHDAGAMALLAVMFYQTGTYVERDYDFALKLLKAGAEADYPPSQLYLGQTYEEGRGVKKDATQAAHWYRKAAEHGDSDAQYRLGMLYWDTDNDFHDADMAGEWLLQAAEQGHADAQYERGNYMVQKFIGAHLVEERFGVEVVALLDEADHWFRKAAEQEHLKAPAALMASQNFRDDYSKRQREQNNANGSSGN